MINLLKKVAFATLLTACGGCDNVPVLEVEQETAAEEVGYDFETWEDCSQEAGDHPCNFTLKDSNGDDWTLYDNHGDVIVLDFSAMWCGVCVNIAPDVQSFQDEYSDQGFVWATILIDDESGQVVDQDDLSRWVSMFGMTTSPVLAGSRDMIDLTAENGYPITSWPTFVVISRDMVLSNGINGWNESVIRAWVEQEL